MQSIEAIFKSQQARSLDLRNSSAKERRLKLQLLLKNFLEMEDDDWHNVLDIDLNSAFYTCRAFARGMIEKGWGRIINLSLIHI